MNKEDLLKLKEKISKLTEEEQKQRNLYLRGLSNGEIEGPMIGYASVDKPFIQYYSNDYYTQHEIPRRTVYEEIYENNKNNLKDKALEFFFKKYTFGELFEKIDEVQRALISKGIKKGDFVTVCSASTPEVVFTFYAISKIGAVANFMSPFFDQKQMADRISECESKLLIVMDSFYPIIKDAINNSSIEETIILPTLNSSILRYIPSKGKVLPNNSNEILWNDFIENGQIDVELPIDRYEEEKPLCMVYSSGTTGASKAIMLSNDSFQNSIHAYPITGLDVHRGQKFYQIIPPWFSTGLSTSIHLPLSYGASVFMDPRFERKVFVSNIIKHKFDATVAATSMYEGFQESKYVKNKKISNLSNAFQGGEKLDYEKKCAIEKVWKEHGCNSILKVGYGECECGAGISTQTDAVNTPGTVGIPLAGINVGIYDDNRNEKTFGERGELLVDTKCGMIEYYKNPEETAKFFYYDDFGTKWYCTGDMAYINPNGEIVILGRKSDYSLINNKKVYNFDIENIISIDKSIKNVDVFAISNNQGVQELVCNLVFNDDINLTDEQLLEKFKQIQKLIYENNGFDYDLVPTKFKVWNIFPAAKSGKRDMNKMIEEAKSAISVDLDNSLVKKIK